MELMMIKFDMNGILMMEFSGKKVIVHMFFNESNFNALIRTKYIINLDQLAHIFNKSFLRINCSDLEIKSKIESVVNETIKEINYSDEWRVGDELSTSVDARPYFDYKNKLQSARVKIDHINFCKNNFTNYHQTGADHTLGDSMLVINEEYMNDTADIVLSVVKFIDSYEKEKFPIMIYLLIPFIILILIVIYVYWKKLIISKKFL
jgi:hypothetical protein